MSKLSLKALLTVEMREPGASLDLEQTSLCLEQIYIEDLPKIDCHFVTLLEHAAKCAYAHACLGGQENWKLTPVQSRNSREMCWPELQQHTTWWNCPVQLNPIPWLPSNEEVVIVHFQQLCNKSRLKPSSGSARLTGYPWIEHILAVRDKKLEAIGMGRGLCNLDHPKQFSASNTWLGWW